MEERERIKWIRVDTPVRPYGRNGIMVAWKKRLIMLIRSKKS